jgi:hypothetical protein
MNARGRTTVMLMAGLPYSGKTAVIMGLLERLPGKALYIDAIFRDFVEEKDVCLKRWLAEGTRLVDRIIRAIEEAEEPVIYVEIGILQPVHRLRLMEWVKSAGHLLVPVLLECRSREEVRERQAARERSLAAQSDRLKIAIGLEELYGPISEAFMRPGDDEGFLIVDTTEPLADNVERILRNVAQQ